MKQEVAVIGGSAAGLFTAHLLAARGLPVQILEEAAHLDPLPRTLVVTSCMRKLLGPLGQRAIVNQVRHYQLFTDGRVGSLTLEQPDLVIERARLIPELADQARSAGAQILLGRRFLSLRPNGTGLVLEMERDLSGGSEELSAKTVIGADGAFSRVARSAGWPDQATVPLVQAIVRLPPDLPPDTTRVWFIPDDTPYFYWLIPESAERGALGLIGEDGQATRASLERFLARQGLDPIEFQAARIPAYAKWIPVHRRVGRGDVYLVGDAGGHVKVTTVGGIVTGFRGALGVAEAVLNGGSSRNLRALRHELELHLLIRRALHRFTQTDYCRVIDLLNGATRRLLGTYSRDEAGKILLRLCVSQPRFLLLGLRALLTSSRARS